MKRLTKHIEALLFLEECVVVPNLGAFIRHNHPARIDEASGVIQPGYTSLSFNPALQHQDALLVERYMRAFSYSYRRATALLDSDVRELREELRRTGIVQMGRIGRLILNKQAGTLTFLPSEPHPFSLDYLGLQPLTLLPDLATRGATSTLSGSNYSGSVASVGYKGRVAEKHSGEDIFYLPINLRHIRYGALATMAATCILLFSPSASDSIGSREYIAAGFMNTEVAQPKPLAGSTSQQGKTKALFQAADEERAIEHETASLEAKSVATEELKAETTTLHQAMEAEADVAPQEEHLHGLKARHIPTGEVQYYIIIASLQGEEQLAKYMELYSPSILATEHAGVAISGKLYRVFISSHRTLEAATKELQQLLKEDTIPETSWIYRGK